MTIHTTALRILPAPSSPGQSFRRLSASLACRFAVPALALGLLLPSTAAAHAQATPAEPSADQSTPAKPLQPATAPEAAAPAPPAATASAGPSSQVDSNSYVIGPEDVLQITVWHEPTLSGVLPVRPDGMISLALLGDVKAAGDTPVQLSTDLTERLRKYLQEPSVTVAVTGVNSKKVFLVGEVARVGPMPLTPGMTPLQAISTAGGPSPFANTKHIYILRGTGAKQQKIPFNYKQALKGDDKSGLTLQPGDTIVVP